MSQPRDRRIVLGPFQPDLEEALVAEVADLRRRDPLGPAVLLVGSNTLGSYLMRLLARQLGGVAGLRALTFLDLARWLARSRILEDGLRPLTPAGERLLAQSLAGSLAEDSYFAPIAGTPGFRDALLATLIDLRDAGLGGNDLRAAFAAGRRKARELADLLDGLEGRLARAHAIDRSGLMSLALEVVAGKGPAAGPGTSPGGGPGPPPPIRRLLVYGFYDFTWMQEQLLHRLVTEVPATLFCPWREGPAFEYAAGARERLLKLFPGGDGRPPGGDAPPVGGPGAARPMAAARSSGAERTVETVARRLFRTPPEIDRAEAAGSSDGSVRIIAAPGEPREALEAVRAVVDWARRGVPLEEIALLYRAGEHYPSLLTPLLRELGIPFFSTEGTPLRLTRAARTVSALFEVIETDYERGRVIELLSLSDPRSPLFAPDRGTDPGGGPPAATSDWDLLSRRAGIVQGRRQWAERLKGLERCLSRRTGGEHEALEEEGPRPDPALAREARRLPRVFSRLASRVERIPRTGRWSAIARSIGSILDEVLAPGDDRQAVLELVEGLASLDSLARSTDLSGLRRMLELEIGRSGRTEGRFQRGHLFLGDVLASRGLSFRVVVLAGMVEQGFPVASRQDPILLDEERQSLNDAAGAPRLPIKSRRALEERLLFALAAGAAREALVLLFPRIDPRTARERVPSSFLLRAVEAITRRPCDYAALEAFPAYRRVRLSELFPSDRRLAVREREFDLRTVEEGADRGDPGRALLPAAIPGTAVFYRRGLRFQRRRAARRLTSADGVLSSDAARSLLRQRFTIAGRAVSASRLEQYMTCPYQYFCRCVLGLEPLEAPEDVEPLSPLGRGTLMHAVLREFYAGLLAGDRLPPRRRDLRALRRALLEIARRRFAELERRGRAGPPLLRRVEREAIEDDLLRSLDREIEEAESAGPDAARPRHLEARFGMPARRDDGAAAAPEDPLSTDEPVSLSLGPDGTLLFRGRVDRIDLTPDGESARVIEYKSGRLDAYQDDSHGGGTALQLPIYILAAETLLPGTRVREALYRSVSRRGRFAEVRFGRERWSAALDELREVGRVVQSGLASGLFFHYPDAQRQCRGCDYRPVCGESREARFRRKSDDPVASPFRSIKERRDAPR